MRSDAVRIVQAAGWYFPDSLGGTEIYVDNLAHHLRRRGHEVQVAAPDAAHALERHYVHDGVPVYRYPIPPQPSRHEARGLTRVGGAELFHRWLVRQRPDVVHVHTFVTGLGLAEVAAARAAGARVVCTTHSASLGFLCERGTLLRDGRTLCDANVSPGTCALCALKQRGLPQPLASAVVRLGAAAPRAAPATGRLGTALGLAGLVAERRRAQAQLFDLVDGFVVLSEWAKHVVVTNGAQPDKVVVNRLGVAHRPGGWPAKPDASVRPTRAPITVGFLGRAEAIKGLDDLVAALAYVPNPSPLAVKAVVVASSDAERRRVSRARRVASRDTRLTILPPVAPRDVAGVLASFDVLCCPSRAVEGGPTVALEAHAVGTPVVGSDLPALSEIVRPDIDGALVPPGDRRALAALLTSLATDPSRIDRWRTHLRPPRTFDAVVAEYLKLYCA